MPADNRVLILAQRAATRVHLAELLRRLGYLPTQATATTAAQVQWERDMFPIIFLDLRNAHVQIADLRQWLPNSTIIALGPRKLPEALAAWHAGADDYLSWPVGQADLAGALQHGVLARAARAEPSASLELRRMAGELARQISLPLTPILGMVDLLAEELPAKHPGREYAQVIIAAALRIRDIAWMLADMARQDN